MFLLSNDGCGPSWLGGSAAVWICDVGGEAAGYVLVRKARRPESVFCDERYGHEVDQISVHPKVQGAASRALLERVADFAAGEDVHEVELNTWFFNEPAQSALGKLGLSVKNIRFSRRARS
jgi:hypothetical protein